MLYSEFIAGTGCKDTTKNYEVYKNLEIMYMNSDLPKEVIYEYGKKLVDNSKTAEEIRFENERKAEIMELKKHIEYCKEEVIRYNTLVEWSKDQEEIKNYKRMIKYYKNEIREYKNKVNIIKTWFLS